MSAGREFDDGGSGILWVLWDDFRGPLEPQETDWTLEKAKVEEVNHSLQNSVYK